MKYFSNLKYGWADLNIGDFTCKCSYTQNIPMIFLKAWNNLKKNGYCVINIDSEGYDSEIIITELSMNIITYRGFIEYYNFDKYFKDYNERVYFLNDLIKEIIENIEEWAKWLCVTDPNSLCYDNIISEYIKSVKLYAEKMEFKY